MKANLLTSLVLYAWPFVVILVYAARRASGRLARTTAWMIILPVMFLPSMHQLEIAALNKHRISFLSVALALQLFHRRDLLDRARWQSFPRLVLLALTLGVIQTVRTNGDVLVFGPLVLPSLTWRDGWWMTYGFVVDAYVPFAVGQRVFKTERDVRDLLEVLSTCALIYVPLCLLEIRLSPQLHTWVYGYRPSSFIQAMRGTGYRPVVFMNHGLSVAMFMFSGFCAALALRKATAQVRPAPGLRAGAVGTVLLIGNSLASIMYSVVAALLHLFSTRLLGRAILAAAILVLAYPAVRASNLVPTRAIGEVFGRISEERMRSLVFRFENEDALLARALERPAFGWGNWGRSRVYAWWGTRWDDWAGYMDASVTDGTWIIVLGMFGVVGFAGFFAFLVVPLLRFVWYRRSMPRSSQLLLGTLALILALFTVDLIPNSSSDLLALSYAGALFTLSERLGRRRHVRSAHGDGGDPQPLRERRVSTAGA